MSVSCSENRSCNLRGGSIKCTSIRETPGLKIVCPKCNGAIPSDAVSVARGLAYCARCGAVFSPPEIVAVPIRTARPPDAVTELTRAGKRLSQIHGF